MDIYSPVNMVSVSRTQERAELQQLNDRFSAYVAYVRQLAERNNQVDSTALLKSTRALEMEITNLKNLYEVELEKLRKEVEICSNERSSLQVQINKQLQCNAELQDRLTVEGSKSSKLVDEVQTYQGRMCGLEAELQDLRISASRPQADVDRLQREVENRTREMEAWKKRYEHEQIARQEAENKIQQLIQKSEFNDKVHGERVGELHSRAELSAATILSLEAKIRDLSKADVSVSELLKQVRDSAEAELRKFQFESEEQYNRNLTALKAQLDNECKAVQQLVTERTQLRGSVGELQARIRALEGQVANLEHQKQTLEDAVAVERNRAADTARGLEGKLREVQDMLVLKMREVTAAREHSIPLKAEIEALKALLVEEERRLRVPLGTVTSGGGILSPVAPPTSLLPFDFPLPSTMATAAVTTSSNEPLISSVHHQSLTTPMSNLPPVTSSIAAGGSGAHQTVSFMNQAQQPSSPPPSFPAPLLPSSQTFVSAALPTSAADGDAAGLSSSTTAAATAATAITTAAGGGGGGEGMFSAYETDVMDLFPPSTFGASHNATPYTKYSYEATPGLSRLAMEPNASINAATRAQSAPAERYRHLHFGSGEVGQDYSYCDKMAPYDFQRDAIQERPKTYPLRKDRSLSSLYHDYTVSTSSSIGDVKIFEVHQDGKYVRLLNDGVQEIEFGGHMLQQNVGGHPVAVYRFPPRTKFAPNSTITVYASCSDHNLHNPPQDFVWKEQQKWGTGPECTTILCRPSGQAIAWTTAAHRFTRDAFHDGQSEFDDDATRVDDDKQTNDGMDDDNLTEISVNVNEPKPEPVYLRREKQQPPSLQANKHPHGNTSSVPVHPHSGQPRPSRNGNDNSSKNRQSRSQSSRPDPVPGQPYAGAAGQKMGSAPLHKFVPGVSTQPSSGIRVGGKSESSPGKASEVPSPFMKPHSRFMSGLEQVQSQHHADFLPPMPRPPLFSTW